MGKYATYRKRGSYTEAVSLLGPPPAPTLYTDEGELWTSATGEDDTDGTFTLWYRATYEDPWGVYNSGPWQAVLGWGELGDLVEGDYQVVETGNGTAYVGQSPPSNVYSLPG